MGWLAWRSFSRNKRGGAPRPTREPSAMRAVAKPGLKMESVDEAGKAGAQAGATTMVVAAISSKCIRGRCNPGSSTSHPRQCHNSYVNGSTSTSSSTSRDFRSYNSRDRSINSPTPGGNGREHLTISSPTPGAAGEDLLPNSGEEERITSEDHNIGGEISHTSSASCVSSAARRGSSPQTA